MEILVSGPIMVQYKTIGVKCLLDPVMVTKTKGITWSLMRIADWARVERISEITSRFKTKRGRHRVKGMEKEVIVSSVSVT